VDRGLHQKEAADVAQALLDVIRCASLRSRPTPACACCGCERIAGRGLTLLPEVDADRCDFVIGAATQALLGRRAWPLAGDRRAALSVGGSRSPVAGRRFDIVVLARGSRRSGPRAAARERAQPAAR